MLQRDSLDGNNRRLLERDDRTAAQAHVRLAGLLLWKNRRDQAQIRELKRRLAAALERRLTLETARQALLKRSQALWRETAHQPGRAAHPLAHPAARRQRLYGRAYQQHPLRAHAAAQAPARVTCGCAARCGASLSDTPRPERG